jgi:hypothetical protein
MRAGTHLGSGGVRPTYTTPAESSRVRLSRTCPNLKGQMSTPVGLPLHSVLWRVLVQEVDSHD